ncbi:MAG: hypothetical protein ACO1PI_08175 [Bacteroidota bacterium]
MKPFIKRETVLRAALAATLTFFITSCNKKEQNPSPSDYPAQKAVFDIQSPKEGTVFNIGDTVWLKGTVTTQDDLHGYDVKITNTTAQSVVFFGGDHLHGNTIVLNSFWVNNVKTSSEMVFELAIAKNHSGDIERQLVNFHCHP